MTKEMENWLDVNYSEAQNLLQNVTELQNHFSIPGELAVGVISQWLSDKGD